MREFTKYHDTSKSVKERAKTKVFGAVYSHTAIILLLILLQIGIMILSGKLQYLYERSDVPSLLYYSDLYF